LHNLFLKSGFQRHLHQSSIANRPILLSTLIIIPLVFYVKGMSKKIDEHGARADKISPCIKKGCEKLAHP